MYNKNSDGGGKTVLRYCIKRQPFVSQETPQTLASPIEPQPNKLTAHCNYPK